MTSSSIYTGFVVHGRHEPVTHDFQYPVYLYYFDIDDLQSFDKVHFWFGYNKRNLISIFDKDYLIEGAGSLRDKVLSLLKRYDLSTDHIAKIGLLTGARFLNYVFNPVSFFYCYNDQLVLEYVIVEINNTFDERHVYILKKDDFFKFNKNSAFLNTRKNKAFHVSPFNDMEGEYDFYFSDIEKTMDIRINIVKDKKTVFNSRLWGDRQEFSAQNVAKTIFKYPLSAVLSMPRILFQAGKLHYFKKLAAYKKPFPVSEFTIKHAKPSFLERLAMRSVFSFLENIKKGSLSLRLPEGEVKTFGIKNTGSEETYCSEIQVQDYAFFWKIFTRAAVGLGEAYINGDWTTPDLTRLIALLIDNKPFLDEKKLRTSGVIRLLNRVLHLFNRNTLRGSKKNISLHYDLSNEFYEVILDPTMTYSCAIFNSGDESTEQAQYNKIRAMLEKAKIESENHLLEIGSGWGTLALTAAKDYACKVTSITLSEEQLTYARERAKAQNLTSKVNFTLCDYRKLQGKYDRIVSVEMLEAVGEEYLGKFFNVCDNVLAEDGIIVLQVITMPEDRYKIYRRASDWIQKYIFPGATVPSLQVISDAIAKNSTLEIESMENIGPFYAPTLKYWRENFLANVERIQQLGFDQKFVRKWDYYFSYCEAAFMTRTLNVLQMVLTRSNNKHLRDRDSDVLHKENLTEVKIRA